MKKQIIAIGAIFIVLAGFITSCKKDPGQGGNVTITGKVHAKYYNATFQTLLGTGYSPERDVYIIYGNDASFSDRTRSNYDGTFEFKYLRKGNYKVYVYSKDSAQIVQSGIQNLKYAVIQEVTATDNKQTITLDDLEIFD